MKRISTKSYSCFGSFTTGVILIVSALGDSAHAAHRPTSKHPGYGSIRSAQHGPLQGLVPGLPGTLPPGVVRGPSEAWRHLNPQKDRCREQGPVRHCETAPAQAGGVGPILLSRQVTQSVHDSASRPVNPDQVVLALYGKSSSRDHVILGFVERARKGERISAYRLDNESHIHIRKSGETFTGHVSNVFVYDPKTGKVERNSKDEFPLPTVFYGFDFYQYQAARSKVGEAPSQDVPSASDLHKEKAIKENIRTIAPAFINADEEIHVMGRDVEGKVLTRFETMLTEPLANQAYVYQILSEIGIPYPETYQYEEGRRQADGARYNKASVLSYFFSKYNSVFIKSVGGLKGKKAVLYITRRIEPARSYFLITYKAKKTNPDGEAMYEGISIPVADDFDALATEIQSILATQFRNIGPLDPLVIQAAQKGCQHLTTDLNRQISHIRVNTQRDGKGEVIATSMYGVIGGRRGIDGLVEDPRALIYSALIDAYQASSHPEPSDARYAEILDFYVEQLKTRAAAAHHAIDTKAKKVRGELVVDFIIDNQTPDLKLIPLKIRFKPEEVDVHVEVELEQRFLINKEQRKKFLTDKENPWSLTSSEKRRVHTLIDYTKFVHTQKFGKEKPVPCVGAHCAPQTACPSVRPPAYIRSGGPLPIP